MLEFRVEYRWGIPKAVGLGDSAYAKLKEMVLTNRLRPGQKLLDRELAQQLGVSRTPIREALSRLQQDGLVTTRLGRGYFVAELDAKQAEDLYDLREVLEVHAVRLAAERAKPEDLEELAGVLATLDTYRDLPDRRGEEIRLGLRVHEIIARSSGNQCLYDTLAKLLERMLCFIWIEILYEDPVSAETSRREHARLLALIREKRVDEAEAVIRAHRLRSRGRRPPAGRRPR